MTALATLSLALLFAGFCAFQGWRASHDTLTPIAHLEPGQKVDVQISREALNAAVRDLGPSAAQSKTRVDPATWKLLILRAECEWDDGTLDDINVKTLQPPEWLCAHQVHVGGDAPIPLDLVEMGLPDGLRAKVLAIKPCPPIEPGSGRIVLTTVNHLNADVMELTVEASDGRRETFRPTASHKFYRETDNRWISTHELRQGDHLTGTCGPLTVVASRRLPGTHRVYNLTVEGEHVYRVSSFGTLAHNIACTRTVKWEDRYYNVHNRVLNSLDHVWLRHRFGSQYQGVSRFSSEFATKHQVKGLITDAIRKGHIEKATRTADGGVELIVRMDRTIGLTRDGRATEYIIILLDPANSVKTAFPF